MQMQEAEGGSPWPSLSPWPKPMAPAPTQCLAEFLGVFVLMVLTQEAVAQAVTNGETKNNFFTMILAGWLVVVIAIYVGDV